MKVLDLQCRYQHSFEGWFSSEDDFQNQLGQNLIECPLCSDKTITKMLSAPRLNFGAAQSESKSGFGVGANSNIDTVSNAADLSTSAPSAVKSPPRSEVENGLQAAWLQMVRHVVANTEDVGNKFAEEARKIHYGESAERAIRGQASRHEAAELLEEGISLMPLRIPTGFNGPLQ